MEPHLDGAEGEKAAGGEEHLGAGNGRESVNGVDNCVRASYTLVLRKKCSGMGKREALEGGWGQHHLRDIQGGWREESWEWC